jgi:phage-related protein
MAIAYPIVVYGQDSTIDSNPRLIRTSLGDGNQQVTADGINWLEVSGTLQHPLLDSATASTLRTFLQTNTAGQVVSIVNWMQDYNGSTTLNVILTGWRESFDGVTYNFDVNYEKVNRTV